MALIGATRGLDDDTYDTTGSAYLFDVTTGQLLLKLKYSDAHQGDRFGQSVALSDTTALVGAIGGAYYHNQWGKAYLFDVATGQELAKLENADCCGGEFGNSVALSGNAALISAPFFDEGRVYVFSAAPEPGSFSLAACAFAAMGTLARKRHRSDDRRT